MSSARFSGSDDKKQQAAEPKKSLSNMANDLKHLVFRFLTDSDAENFSLVDRESSKYVKELDASFRAIEKLKNLLKKRIFISKIFHSVGQGRTRIVVDDKEQNSHLSAVFEALHTQGINNWFEIYKRYQVLHKKLGIQTLSVDELILLSGNLTAIKNWLEKHKDRVMRLQVLNDYGSLPIHYLVFTGSLKAVEFYQAQGFPMDYADWNGKFSNDYKAFNSSKPHKNILSSVGSSVLHASKILMDKVMESPASLVEKCMAKVDQDFKNDENAKKLFSSALKGDLYEMLSAYQEISWSDVSIDGRDFLRTCTALGGNSMAFLACDLLGLIYGPTIRHVSSYDFDAAAVDLRDDEKAGLNQVVTEVENQGMRQLLSLSQRFYRKQILPAESKASDFSVSDVAIAELKEFKANNSFVATLGYRLGFFGDRTDQILLNQLMVYLEQLKDANPAMIFLYLYGYALTLASSRKINILSDDLDRRVALCIQNAAGAAKRIVERACVEHENSNAPRRRMNW